MSQAVPLRLTAGLVLVPIAALLLAECGGNDLVDSADASDDATFEAGALDAVSDAKLADRPAETASGDSGLPDAKADGGPAVPDAEGGSSDAGDASNAYAADADAGSADAGDADAGSADAGSADAGDADAGSADAADADAGDADAGDADAGSADAGSADADAASADADAGSADAADADAGVDGGTVAAPTLGSAKSFAVLAGSTITNTGATAIVGDVGVAPGTATTGLTAGQEVTGTIHHGDPVATQAEADLTTAFNNLAGRPCQHPMTGVDLGGKTLPPGVYCFGVAAAQTTGNLTLDAQGNPNAVWIFQIASTLTISTGLSTTVTGGGTACNVYWQVGSSATINVDAQFSGNILAQASITMLTRASVSPGRTLTQTAAVTLDTNVISNAGCP
jgi:hypothetical protein